MCEYDEALEHIQAHTAAAAADVVLLYLLVCVINTGWSILLSLWLADWLLCKLKCIKTWWKITYLPSLHTIPSTIHESMMLWDSVEVACLDQVNMNWKHRGKTRGNNQEVGHHLLENSQECSCNYPLLGLEKVCWAVSACVCVCLCVNKSNDFLDSTHQRPEVSITMEKLSTPLYEALTY